jgi:uncharacterized protein (TIGR02118 family)
MIKITALYGHPVDPEAFEMYYAQTHVPIAAKIKQLVKLEATKLLPNPDGSAALYYRMGDLYFNSLEDLHAALASPEGEATKADLSNFATGGVTLIVGIIDVQQ